MIARVLSTLFNIYQIRRAISPRDKPGDDPYTPWMAEFIRKNVSKTEESIVYVLDVGGSTGQFASKIYAEINNKSVLIMNLELNLSSLKRARLMHPELECICADATFLPFKTGAISFIYSISLIEHIGELELGVLEQCRVAKDMVLFQIPNLKYFVELHTFMPLLGFMPPVLRERIWIINVGNAPINWRVSFKELMVLFENNDFSLLSFKKLNPFKVLRWLNYPVGYLAAFKKAAPNHKLPRKLGQT